MTNLADLLPAGGGQNNTEFVADGNISAGAPVILTSDGKAAEVVGSSSTTAAAAQTPDNWHSQAVNQVYSVWDTSNNKLVVLWSDSQNSNYGVYRIASLDSSGTLTWGTKTTWYSYGTSMINAAYTKDGKIVIFFEDAGGSYWSRLVVGEISGTSMSIGSVVDMFPANNYGYGVAYDTTNDVVVCVITDFSTSYYGRARTATISGTTLTRGTAVTYRSANSDNSAISYDSTLDKFLITFREADSSNDLGGVVGTTSGNSISFGTPSTGDTSVYCTKTSSAYDPNATRNLVSYYDASTGNVRAVVAGISGTNISWGTPITVEFTNYGSDYRMPVTYNENIQKCIITYTIDGTGTAKYVIATVSGSFVTVGSAVTIDSGTYSTNMRQLTCPYDPVTKQNILTGRQDSSTGPGDVGASIVFNQEYTTQSTNLTSTNLLGLAPEAISDTATGTINTLGSRCESSSLLADSLSLGSPDTTSGNGQKENVSMAYDSNADRTILVYRDGGDSDKLKCIIGTLSGTSTSWGTPVEIVGATAGNTGTAVVYDSNAQRVLIAYTKASDTYAYVRVGQISGTSVTLGTEVAASSSSAYYSELSYDVADQKVLLVFANAGDNYYPYSAACTITAVGNSVAVTTPALVSSRNAYDPFGLAYNVNDGKHVLDITDNTSTGYAYVLTMSSGSISVGAEASYSPGFTPRQSICVYDSSAQKIVRAYYSNSSPYPVSAAVASISGTNVTFGTAATAFTTNSGTRFHGTFDSSSNQVGLVSRTDSTNYIETNFGSVSGTTITFGTATSVYSGGTASTNYNIVYDSTAQKLIYAYAGATYDAVVGSFGTTPLTIGTDYYVQAYETATISTDSTSPAQLIGNAIKTNQINIKDYTG